MSRRRIPLDLLFGEPRQITPQIAPDGKSLAFLAPRNGVLNLWLQPLSTDAVPQPLTDEHERGILYYVWAAGGKELLYLLDRGGDERWRLLAVDAHRGGPRELVAVPGAKVGLLSQSQFHPGAVLITLDQRRAGESDVYRLDLVNGTLDLVAENPGAVAEWIVDRDLHVRAAMATRSDAGSDLLVPEPDSPTWRRSVSWSAEDSLTSAAVGVGPTGMLYLIDSRDRDTNALVEFDPTAQRVTRVLMRDDRYDIARLLCHPDTGSPEAVCVQRERSEWHPIDPGIEADFRALRRLFQGDFFVISRERADRRWVVAVFSDVHPVAFHLYDRSTRNATFLFEHEPRLRDYDLAPMRSISFAARDGLLLHGYLTLPPLARGTPAPLVLNVHSGPWTRDEWGFNPHVQWLANRGYACLQIDFRGSTGYGKRFLNAGNREWGGKMQDDLTDALQWAIANRIARPKRIAVYGLSYGGYAALMAAAEHSDLLACVVDVAGPTDLAAFVESATQTFGSYGPIFLTRVGDPAREREFLYARSPLAVADRIRIPVLIAHGENDPRVPREHSDRMAAALTENGVNCRYEVFPGEGHGFGTPSARLRFYDTLEQFLATHLPVTEIAP